MSPRYLVLTAWCAILGITLFVLFDRASSADLPPCNGMTEPKATPCGTASECEWFSDDNENGQWDEGEEIYVGPDGPCGGFDIAQLTVVQDCVGGKSSQRCVTADDPITCTAPHQYCGWKFLVGAWHCVGDQPVLDKDGNAVVSKTKTGKVEDCAEED
jgi:hypothetical protein